MAPTKASAPEGKRPLAVNIDEDLHRRLKTGSILLDSTMSAILAALINDYMPTIANGVPTWNERRRKELVNLLSES